MAQTHHNDFVTGVLQGFTRSIDTLTRKINDVKTPALSKEMQDFVVTMKRYEEDPPCIFIGRNIQDALATIQKTINDQSKRLDSVNTSVVHLKDNKLVDSDYLNEVKRNVTALLVENQILAYTAGKNLDRSPQAEQRVAALNEIYNQLTGQEPHAYQKALGEKYKPLVVAAKNFMDKVESGRARSVNTYKEFKEAMEVINAS